MLEPLCLTFKKENKMTNTNLTYLNLQEQLIDAARNADIVAVKRLIKAGVNPFKIGWHGNSAISYLLESNLHNIERIILELTELSSIIKNGGDNDE